MPQAFMVCVCGAGEQGQGSGIAREPSFVAYAGTMLQYNGKTFNRGEKGPILKGQRQRHRQALRASRGQGRHARRQAQRQA